MAVLVKKVTRAKWGLSRGALAKNEISADAVAADMRTTNENLSFWRCRSDANLDVDDAVRALAFAGDRFDLIDIAWVQEEKLRSAGLDLHISPGRTVISSLRHAHVDIIRLDIHPLVKLAQLISSAHENGATRRVSRAGVQDLARKAFADGLVEVEECSDKIREFLTSR